MAARWWCILISVFWLGWSGHTPALAGRTEFADGYLNDRSNGDRTLVILVAGLAGAQTWDAFTRLMDADGALQSMDYLVYHSPQDFDIDENVDRLETVLRQVAARYPEQVFVGHSIGGFIVKRLLLRRLSAAGGNAVRPRAVMTFGTPLDPDKFSVSMFKRLGARVFWASVPRLKREVFNLDRLREINQAWRQAMRLQVLGDTRLVSVFGVDDDIAPSAGEAANETSLFIRGDHLGIAAPKGADDCPYVIFRTVLSTPAAGLRSLACVRH